MVEGSGPKLVDYESWLIFTDQSKKNGDFDQKRASEEADVPA